MASKTPTPQAPRPARNSALIEGIISAILGTAAWEAGLFLVHNFFSLKNSELTLPLWVYLPYPLVLFLLMSILAALIVRRSVTLEAEQGPRRRIVRAILSFLLVIGVPLLIVAGYISWTQGSVSQHLSPECSTSQVGGTWENKTLGRTGNRLVVEFDATPYGIVDEVFALSSGSHQSYDEFACLVRFYSDYRIQMWSGLGGDDLTGRYDNDNAVNYMPNVRYHFSIFANAPEQKCTAYVSTPSEGAHFLGTFKFRTQVNSLDNFGVHMDPPGNGLNQSPERLVVKICNLTSMSF